MVSGYVQFIGLLAEMKERLKEREIGKPACGLSRSSDWRACEIEMALFCWAGNRRMR
jgi:hypothetical protein